MKMESQLQVVALSKRYCQALKTTRLLLVKCYNKRLNYFVCVKHNTASGGKKRPLKDATNLKKYETMIHNL